MTEATSELFGQMPDGTEVRQVTLRGGGLVAKVLTLGAIVHDLRLAGVSHPLVLGAQHPATYLEPMQFVGAMVGRFANRIAQGRFTLDGVEHQITLPPAARHALHGGATGSGARVWRIEAQSADSVTLALDMADGEMGFPGNLTVRTRIALSGDGVLAFEVEATTDRATPCGFSHHGYFALDDTGDLSQHRLQIAAEHYLPVDDALIPTGEIAPVAGTDFDFRHPRILDRREIDHNFCLSRERVPLRPVARLDSRASGLVMEMGTTEPGLQVYTGKHFTGTEPGLEGRRYGAFAGIALEAQGWPDAPNRPAFPQSILRPGGVYRQVTQYRFTAGVSGAD